MMSKEQLQLLQHFVETCKTKPDILHLPELKFYRDFLESFGAKIPPPKSPPPQQEKTETPPPSGPETSQPKAQSPESEDESPESEVELDQTGVVEPDTGEPLPNGDPSVTPTDEQIEKADEKRGSAMSAFSEGNYEESVKLLTEAIELNPGLALLHAKRANALLKLNKPLAAIRDCDKAISINPDSAQPYKFRGRASRLLGHWDEAYKDLAMACKLDYDDQAYEWMKEVEANAKKLLEHKRKQERKREEKELKKRAERVRKAKEEYEKQKAQQQQQEEQQDDDDMGDFGAAGGMPGMPPGLGEIFKDPELMEAFKDPEVAAAFADVSQNPMNIGKHQSNPKVAKVLEKLAQKIGGGGGGGMGFPGGMFGGMGGPGAGAGGGGASSPPPQPKPDIDID